MHKEVVIQKNSYLIRPYGLRCKKVLKRLNGGKLFSKFISDVIAFAMLLASCFLAGNSFAVRCRVTSK